MHDHRYEAPQLVGVLLHLLEGKLQFELFLQGVELRSVEEHLPAAGSLLEEVHHPDVELQ